MSEIKAGTLYLVPTPIGNLSDMTERAISVLQQVDYIAAEDTRHSGILLKHLDIHVPMISYHEHNKNEMGPRLIKKLKDGLSIAQLSDAGMPVISDPGADLVKLALEAAIEVVPLPGPNAALTALIASGLDARQFTFIGFLPKTTAKSDKLIAQVKSLFMTLIFYEAPHRLKSTLKYLEKQLGNRNAVLARELTKKFETFSRGRLKTLIEQLEETPARGEYVVLIEGKTEQEIEQEEQAADWREYALELTKEMSLKEAARQAAKKYNLSRRNIYQYLLSTKNSLN